MEKYEILRNAVKKFPRELWRSDPDGSSWSTPLGLIHSLIDSITISGLSDEEKRKKLEEVLQNLWKGNKKINGCSREKLRGILQMVFGVSSRKSGGWKPPFNTMTFEECYLYYCYIERLAKSSQKHHALILKECESEKNCKKQIEEEQRKQKEQKRLEEEQRIQEMSSEERIRYEIFEKAGKDMEYYQRLEKDEENMGVIARSLKEYWMKQEKWENDKASKKQVEKIKKVKEILGENG